MVVGVCEVVLSLSGNRSLKGKRAVLRKVLDRTRHRFHISIAEVADNDEWERAVLGFAVVGNERAFVNSRIDKVLDFIDGIGEAPIAEHQLEIVSY